MSEPEPASGLRLAVSLAGGGLCLLVGLAWLALGLGDGSPFTTIVGAALVVSGVLSLREARRLARDRPRRDGGRQG